MAESLIPAHGAGRWVPCPGSVMMQAQYPPFPGERNEVAEEGKAFHALSARMLRDFISGDNVAPSRDDLVGTLSANNVMIDDMMYQSAVDFTTDVFRYCNQHGCLRDVRVEEVVPLDFLAPGERGYPDVWIYNRSAHELVVWDSKYGHSIVEAFENWQLILYAEALIRELGLDGVDDQYLTIRLRVFQPRAFHADGPAREWVVRASDLRGYVNQAINAATEAMQLDARCNAGPWCKGCSGRRGCATLQQSVYAAIDYASTSSNSAEMTGDHLSLELQILRRAKRLISARLDGLEEQAEATIRNGQQLRGFDLRATAGRRTWRKDIPVEQIAHLGDLYGIDLRKPPELVTPKQAETKGIDETVIKEYSDRGSTGHKLVEDDGSQARQAFRK